MLMIEVVYMSGLIYTLHVCALPGGQGGGATDPERETRKPPCGLIAIKNGQTEAEWMFSFKFICSPVHCRTTIVTLKKKKVGRVTPPLPTGRGFNLPHFLFAPFFAPPLLASLGVLSGHQPAFHLRSVCLCRVCEQGGGPVADIHLVWF